MSSLITNRRAVRETPGERQKIWRNKFRSQCEERVKQARRQQIDARRQDKWLSSIILQEWQQFQKEHEEAFKQEEYNVYTDIEAMIEDSLKASDTDDYYAQYEEYERLQQSELEMAIDTFENPKYPNLICMKCQHPSQFNETNDGYQCSLCLYHIKNKVFQDIQLSIQTHSTTCQNIIIFTIEPGNENNILGFCNDCDLWVIF